MSSAFDGLPEEPRLTIVNGKQECLKIECEHEKGTEVLYIDSDTAIHSRPRNIKTKKPEVRHPFDNSLMVYVQASKFWMGSDLYATEQPEQKIYLDGYFIDMFPVTIKRFKRFISETGYITDTEKSGRGMVRYNRKWEIVPEATWKTPDGLSTIEEKDKHPASQVSYNDALAYCRWANKDLPTEAQWEKAARGPKGMTYPWGDNDPDKSTYLFGFRCAIDRIKGIEKQVQGIENQLKTQENLPLSVKPQPDPKMPEAGDNKKPLSRQIKYHVRPDGRIILERLSE